MADTVAIHHPGDPKRPTVIRADRFDPKRHRLWGADQEVAHDADHEEPGGDASSEADPERADEDDGPDADPEVERGA